MNYAKILIRVYHVIKRIKPRYNRGALSTWGRGGVAEIPRWHSDTRLIIEITVKLTEYAHPLIRQLLLPLYLFPNTSQQTASVTSSIMKTQKRVRSHLFDTLPDYKKCRLLLNFVNSNRKRVSIMENARSRPAFSENER